MQLPSSDSISPVLQQPVIERINRLSGRFHRDQIQRFYLVMGSASGNAAFSVIRLIDLCVYPPPPPSLRYVNQLKFFFLKNLFSPTIHTPILAV